MARSGRSLPQVGSRWRLGVGAALLVVCGGLASHAQTPRRPYAVIAYGGNYLHNYLIPPAPSATPFAPVWSPDGQRLAFSLHGSIWIMAASGGAAREVVTGAKYYSSPTWSPDGRWIVYTADDGGKTIELEVLNVATGATTPLTQDGTAYLDPLFSPDGARLAYVAARPNGYLNVFVRGIREGAWDGEPMAITEDSTTPVPLERPYFTPQDMHTAPSWITDGELLIVSNRGVPLGSGAIVRVPVEPLGIRRARVVIDEQTLYHARPTVSPDGKRLAYVSAAGGRQARHHLVVRALDNDRGRAAPVILTQGSFDVFRPRWSPDGRRLLFLSNERGLPELAIIDAARATPRPRLIPVETLTYRDPRAHLTVTVRDASSGANLPARVHVVAADGRAYAQTGEYARVSWAGDRVFHTAGTFALDLPAGRARLQVVHGFEFKPAQIDVDAVAGERRTVDVKLERIDDVRARGWHAGSTGAHMQASGLQLERLDALVRMAEAEDVAIVSNPLADRPHDGLTERDVWTAGAAAHPASSRLAQLVIGQEHRPPFFGHIMGFGQSGWLASLAPVTIGYESPPGTSLARTNTDVLREMRARGAITSYVHAFSGEPDPMQAGLGIGKAFPVDAALGLVDTLEWAAASRGSFVPWYAALNNGLRIAAIGGEDSITNLHISRLVGCVRTYVFLDRQPLTPTTWWNAAKAGRAFVTTGPLVELRVNGELPGSDISLPAAGPVEVNVRVRSITPLQRVQLVMNGRPVQDVPLDDTRTRADWQGRVPVERSGWLHLRAEGTPSERAPLDALYAQAFTNPIWLTVAGKPVRDRAAADYALQWIDRLQIMADAWPGWTSADARAHVFGQFEEARRIYRRFAQEAGEPATTPQQGERGGGR